MARKSVSELEKRTVSALIQVIEVNQGVQTKLLRAYLAHQLMVENGRLPYSCKGIRLTQLPTTRQIITMLRRNSRLRRNRVVYWRKPSPFLIWWYVGKVVRRREAAPICADHNSSVD